MKICYGKIRGKENSYFLAKNEIIWGFFDDFFKFLMEFFLISKFYDFFDAFFSFFFIK